MGMNSTRWILTYLLTYWVANREVKSSQVSTAGVVAVAVDGAKHSSHIRMHTCRAYYCHCCYVGGLMELYISNADLRLTTLESNRWIRRHTTTCLVDKYIERYHRILWRTRLFMECVDTVPYRTEYVDVDVIESNKREERSNPCREKGQSIGRNWRLVLFNRE